MLSSTRIPNHIIIINSTLIILSNVVRISNGKTGISSDISFDIIRTFILPVSKFTTVLTWECFLLFLNRQIIDILIINLIILTSRIRLSTLFLIISSYESSILNITMIFLIIFHISCSDTLYHLVCGIYGFGKDIRVQC